MRTAILFIDIITEMIVEYITIVTNVYTELSQYGYFSYGYC